jgi:ribonuclease HII
MQELAKKWPVYGFDRHVGYGTKFHNIMLEKYGVIDKIHRKSYKPIKKLIER